MMDRQKPYQKSSDHFRTSGTDEGYHMECLGLEHSYRYQKTGAVADIEAAVRQLEAALAITPPNHYDRPKRSYTLGTMYHARYRRTGVRADIDLAIQTYQESIIATPESDAGRAQRLLGLGIGYRDKYRRTQKTEDLDLASQVLEEAVVIAPEGDSDRAKLLQNLGICHSLKYDKSKDTADLEYAFHLLKRSVDQTTDASHDWPYRLQSLGSVYLDRYEKLDTADDLDTGLQLLQKALEITPKDDLYRAKRLDSLGLGFGIKHGRTQAVTDMQMAIDSFQEALDNTPDDHADRPFRLHSVGIGYRLRFEATGNESDLEVAIQCAHETLDATPDDDHCRQAIRRQSLGEMYGFLYDLTGEVKDAEAAIQHFLESLNNTPSVDKDRAQRLELLGNAYSDKYGRTGTVTDLQKAFQTAQEALGGTPEDDPCRARRLEHLAFVHGDLYAADGKVEDLDLSIARMREALELTPTDDHFRRTQRLQALGSTYASTFDAPGGRREHLDLAMSCLQEALNIMPHDNPGKADLLLSIGDIHRMKFTQHGSSADLDTAIRLFEESISGTPDDHPTRAERLQYLAAGYSLRYETTQAMADLEQDIQRTEEAIRLTEDDNVNRSIFLRNLANGYHSRHERTNSMPDLEKTFQLVQEALEILPDEHFQRPGHLHALVNAHVARYMSNGAMEDLETSIRLGHEVIERTPNEDHQRGIRISNLGRLYFLKFYNETEEITDLEMAIQWFQAAIDLTPEDHQNRAECLGGLGSLYYHRHETLRTTEDLETATQRLRESLHHAISPPISRLNSGRLLMEIYANDQKWLASYETACMTMSLVPLLTPRSLQNSDKQYLIDHITDLASDATAVALKANQSPYDAIQLSELGRGIIAGSLNEMRADVTELQQTHPELAEKYIARRTQLDNPSISMQATQRHNIAQEFEDLIKDIRHLPGFDRFLLPATEEEIKAAAIDGPVVIVNISKYGCDSLIVEATSLRTVPLSQLRIEDIQARIETLQNLESLGVDLLEWLWESIAGPVLDALGFHDTPTSDWPRIWWIPTGLLANFPVHSAGRHCDGGFNTVLDRAISSYSTSIKALNHSRQNRIATKASGPDHIVLVGMQNTPGYSSLPFVTQEIDELEKLCQSTQMQVSRPKSFRQDVIVAMRDCKIFHFAGHGYSDAKDPLDSSLLLTDEPLTVASLFKTNLTGQKPFLAYLSACGTGQVRRDGLHDEGLHLVAACQLAGFRHVIGTLWEVNDESCLEVTIQTYEWMQKHGMSDAAVSEGLHRACRELRRRWVSDSAVRASGRSDKRGQISVQQSLEQTQKHNASNAAASKGRHEGSGGRRGRWMSDKAFLAPLRRQRRSQKSGGESRSFQSNPREARDVEAADDPPLHWVPYIHFGI